MQMSESIAQIDTVYDLAALCYEYILAEVSDNEPLFLATYIYEHCESKENNPNLKMLLSFSSRVEKILRKQDTDGILLEKCLKELKKAAQGVTAKLKPYGKAEQNKLTVLYFILMAIDRYAATKKCFEAGPLNRAYQKATYVYRESGNYILRQAEVKNAFPNKISDSSIKSDFAHLLFLKKEICKGKKAPRVVSLYIDDLDVSRQKIVKGNKLKAAIIPFGEQDMLKFPINQGGMFTIEYREEHRRNGVSRAIALLERAIDKKANIVIFPEFVCNKEIQEAIQARLQEIYRETPKRSEKLLLVAAGTRWSADDNNICYLYGYDGRYLGRQYKSVPFSDTKDSEKKWVEGLKNPGKEITIIDIEGIGKILVGICKDVSQGDYIKQLADVFNPQLLLVPAWSKSVKIGFSEQLREITVKNHRTCAMMCNCCEAMNQFEFRELIGLVNAPHKKGSAVTGKEKEIKRKEAYCKACAEEGCVFIVHLDFSEEKVGKGQMIKRIEQKGAD